MIEVFVIPTFDGTSIKIASINNQWCLLSFTINNTGFKIIRNNLRLFNIQMEMSGKE
jgi:hypothetical protein